MSGRNTRGTGRGVTPSRGGRGTPSDRGTSVGRPGGGRGSRGNTPTPEGGGSSLTASTDFLGTIHINFKSHFSSADVSIRLVIWLLLVLAPLLMKTSTQVFRLLAVSVAPLHSTLQVKSRLLQLVEPAETSALPLNSKMMRLL